MKLSLGTEVFLSDQIPDILINNIVFKLEVLLGILLKDLLHGQVVDGCVRVQPLHLLVDVDEHSSPVGRELKLVFGCSNLLLVDDPVVSGAQIDGLTTIMR